MSSASASTLFLSSCILVRRGRMAARSLRSAHRKECKHTTATQPCTTLRQSVLCSQLECCISHILPQHCTHYNSSTVVISVLQHTFSYQRTAASQVCCATWSGIPSNTSPSTNRSSPPHELHFRQHIILIPLHLCAKGQDRSTLAAVSALQRVRAYHSDASLHRHASTDAVLAA